MYVPIHGAFHYYTIVFFLCCGREVGFLAAAVIDLSSGSFKTCLSLIWEGTAAAAAAAAAAADISEDGQVGCTRMWRHNTLMGNWLQIIFTAAALVAWSTSQRRGGATRCSSSAQSLAKNQPMKTQCRCRKVRNASVYIVCVCDRRIGGLPQLCSLWQFTHYLCVTNLLQPVPPTGSSKVVPCVIMSMW